MNDFKDQADALLKISSEFKKKFSIPETKLNLLKVASLTMVPDRLAELTLQTMKIPVNQMLFAILLGTEIPAGLIGERIIEEQIEIIDKSPQNNYTIKDLSRITGLEDWKIRRVINSDKLKAESKFDEGTNPGRSGYSISKENTIEFLRKNTREILASVNIHKILIDMFKYRLKPYVAIYIDNFLEQVNPIIELGKLEQKLAEVRKEEEKELIIKILLKKLEMEKNFTEELQKNLQKFTASTEQTTETK